MDKERNTFLYGNKDTRKKGEALVPGCIANGIREKDAIIIWDKMVEFARYAFNKSHSAGYADISIKTAFFKTYYPLEFMCHTINSVIGKADLIKKYLNGSKKMGIPVLPPDVNYSIEKCLVEGNSIRIGLTALKNLGQAALPLLEERNDNGKFLDLLDLLNRMAGSFNKKTIEAMAYAGALDDFGFSRKAIITQVPNMLAYMKDVAIDELDGFTALPELDVMYKDLCAITLEDSEEFEKQEKLKKEFEISGMYLSEHPLDDYKDVFISKNIFEIDRLMPTTIEETGEEVDSPLVGRDVSIAGLVKDLIAVYTKKRNQLMYILKIEDQTEIISCVIFPELAAKVKDYIKEGIILNIQGRLESGDRGLQIIAESAEIVDRYSLVNYKHVELLLPDKKHLQLVREIVDSNLGNAVVCVRIKDELMRYQKGVVLNMGTIAQFKEFATKVTFAK